MVELTLLTVVLFVTFLFIRKKYYHTNKVASSTDDVNTLSAKDTAIIERIETSIYEFEKLYNFSSGYFMKKDYLRWKHNDESLIKSLSGLSNIGIRFGPQSSNVKKLKKYYEDISVWTERNEAYKNHELDRCSVIFDNIDGKSLDDQQRDAVVTDEYSNLIIAGAGSGKTLTVVGKIKYLVEEKNINPDEILATSFTKKSVGELQKRIDNSGIKGVDVSTFHKLGLSHLDNTGIVNENALENHIKEYLGGIILDYPDQLASFLQFYGYYSYISQDYDEFESEGARIEDLNGIDLETIKSKIDKIADDRAVEASTLQGERVKSIEELMIANFLYLNGVDYVYEKTYPMSNPKGRKYSPDFYMPEYDLWLEHFGIDEDYRARWIKNELEEQKYIEGITWKRNLHKENGTKLIETYSYYSKTNELLYMLAEKLREQGVELGQDTDRLVEIYKKLKDDDKFSKNIINLIKTFISLYKSNDSSIDYVYKKIKEVHKDDTFLVTRAQNFLSFTYPILNSYNLELQKAKLLDFDDMINKAAIEISKTGPNKNYKYIIVDEYQDISASRFRLINEIRKHTNAKLICVGDDWQSIYRFAGSDVGLFTNFEKYVGYHETLKIENTYRNSQQLVNIASKFVTKNPSQIKKDIHSPKKHHDPIKFYASDDQVSMLENAINNILSRDENYSGKILVLGRHQFDLTNALGITEWTKGTAKAGELILKRTKDSLTISYKGYDNIEFMTVHKSKGLESDDVIIINLVNNLYGFPNKMSDDPIISLLLSDPENEPYAEERRLFYVALTRTKNTVHLLAKGLERKTHSRFFEELIKDNSIKPSEITHNGDEKPKSVECPRCSTGLLIVRKNSSDGSEFIGCTNYPYCDKNYSGKYKDILSDKVKCPQCLGWMVRRKGKYGEFYGCTNFPTCGRTINIVK